MGQFVACASYFATCASYYNALGKKLTNIAVNMAGIERVEELMSWEVEEDFPDAEDIEIRKGSISFQEVSFGYDERHTDGEKYVLKKFSLQIEAGEKIAFVGRSGEGKSTLLQLLCRLYEPWEGEIYVDNVCLTDYTLSSLRRQIAVVQQENGLFHGSLRENICLSEDRGQDVRIWEILEGLKLKELVEQWPEGLNTIIGSGSREMSGGQKQRVAIARCIFRKPKILLLDEATSALDEATEREVNAFIYAELPDTTILSVAHRFSTVLAAGKAVVIEQGRVAAVGAHECLIRENELYRTLYEEYRQAEERHGKK